MSNLAKLEITDGTTTVSLLTGRKDTGFHLTSWRPQIIQPKDGGVYQDSSIAPGRDLVFAVDATANEVFNVKVNGDDQNQLIRTAQDLFRLLTKARNYSITTWQDTPVYLVAKASCETNTRYALIKNYTINDLDNPYSQPFFSASEVVAMNNIAVAVEREHWLSNAPGTGECTEINSLQEQWFFQLAWEQSTAAPAGIVYGFVQTPTSKILATDGAGEIWQTTTDGTVWASATAAPADAYAIMRTTTGRIIAGASAFVWYSDNDGVIWNSVATGVHLSGHFLQTNTGRILSGGSLTSEVYSSIDNGASWALLATLPVKVGTNGVNAIVQTLSGAIILAADYGIYRSTDDGATWVEIYPRFSSSFQSLLILQNGTILCGSNTPNLYASYNDGVNWVGLSSLTTGGDSVYSLLQTSAGKIYAGSVAEIWSSDDNGNTWSQEQITPTSTVFCLLQASSGNIFAGDNGRILKLNSSGSGTSVGRDDTCNDEVYITNHQNVANLTDIYISDGGVFSANMFPMTLPATLLPAVPVVNDALYFGINNTVVDGGPFTSLIFDLSVVAASTNTYTITWEYSNGAAGWPALTIHDGTNNGSGSLSTIGVNSIHWTPPAAWAAEAVNGVTAFWVRARLSALAGTLTPPVQQNRDIYSVVNSYVEVADTEVLGDIPALAQILAHNRSDEDGAGGDAPNLYENRMLIGLRSYDRGATFQAYINCADEQNPFGISVAVGANTTIGADINAPTGRSATYNPGGVEAMATRVGILFGPTIARDYYGTYHAFLRVYATGSTDDFYVQLLTIYGSGGITYTSESVPVLTTTRFEVLDFGQIRIPPAASFGFDELGDTSFIIIMASASGGTDNLVFYDLILMPVDEWAIDSVDKYNEEGSEVGRYDDYDRILNIDSITKPKFPIRSIVQRYGSNLITSAYNSITPGEAILQANARQRLWFFAMQTSATGAAYNWISPPEISHSLQLYKNQRYLSLRGDR